MQLRIVSIIDYVFPYRGVNTFANECVHIHCILKMIGLLLKKHSHGIGAGSRTHCLSAGDHCLIISRIAEKKTLFSCAQYGQGEIRVDYHIVPNDGVEIPDK